MKRPFGDECVLALKLCNLAVGLLHDIRGLGEEVGEEEARVDCGDGGQ